MKRLLKWTALAVVVGCAVKAALTEVQRPKCFGYTVGGKIKDQILEFRIVPITKGNSLESLALEAWTHDKYKEFNGATVKDYLEIIREENADINAIAERGGIAIPTDLTVDIILVDRKLKEAHEETTREIHSDLTDWGLEKEAEALKGDSDLTL